VNRIRIQVSGPVTPWQWLRLHWAAAKFAWRYLRAPAEGREAMLRHLDRQPGVRVLRGDRR
jgi:hypothetical protein